MKLKEILRVTGLLLLPVSIICGVYGQDSTGASSEQAIVAGDTSWYMQPWIWIIVAALVVICIVYYVKGGKRKGLKDGTERGLR